jgi:TonB family protein
MHKYWITSLILFVVIILLIGCSPVTGERMIRRDRIVQHTLDNGKPLSVHLVDRCMYDTTRFVPNDVNWFDSIADKIYIDSPRSIHEVMPRDFSDTTHSPMRGTIWVKAYVDSTGKIIRACIIKSESSIDFDELILRAAMQWEFEPALAVGGDRHLGAFVMIPFRQKDN